MFLLNCHFFTRLSLNFSCDYKNTFSNGTFIFKIYLGFQTMKIYDTNYSLCSIRSVNICRALFWKLSFKSTSTSEKTGRRMLDTHWFKLTSKLSANIFLLFINIFQDHFIEPGFFLMVPSDIVSHRVDIWRDLLHILSWSTPMEIKG